MLTSHGCLAPKASTVIHSDRNGTPRQPGSIMWVIDVWHCAVAIDKTYRLAISSACSRNVNLLPEHRNEMLQKANYRQVHSISTNTVKDGKKLKFISRIEANKVHSSQKEYRKGRLMSGTKGKAPCKIQNKLGHPSPFPRCKRPPKKRRILNY